MGVRMQLGQLYAEAGELDGEGPEAEGKRRSVGQKIAALGNAENESWGVELGYRYDDSPIVVGELNPPAVDPITYRPGTWPGARLPHLFLADGESIQDKLGLYFTLVAVDRVDSASWEKAAEALGIPLLVLQLGRPDLLPIYERNLLLVRPDQHVAWRGDGLPSDIAAVLTRIVGRSVPKSSQ
jgi:hypothetical protein